MINLASNDYLNLTKHPDVIEAGVAALRKYGAGAGGVPLFSGTLQVHKDLEAQIAKFKNCEASIIFSSGYGTNFGVMKALLKKK